MIRSDILRRALRNALQGGNARRPDICCQDDPSLLVQADITQDPDWAIREIVDELVLEPAR